MTSDIETEYSITHDRIATILYVVAINTTLEQVFLLYPGKNVQECSEAIASQQSSDIRKHNTFNSVVVLFAMYSYFKYFLASTRLWKQEKSALLCDIASIDININWVFPLLLYCCKMNHLRWLKTAIISFTSMVSTCLGVSRLGTITRFQTDGYYSWSSGSWKKIVGYLSCFCFVFHFMGHWGFFPVASPQVLLRFFQSMVVSRKANSVLPKGNFLKVMQRISFPSVTSLFLPRISCLLRYVVENIGSPPMAEDYIFQKTKLDERVLVILDIYKWPYCFAHNCFKEGKVEHRKGVILWFIFGLCAILGTRSWLPWNLSGKVTKVPKYS